MTKAANGRPYMVGVKKPTSPTAASTRATSQRVLPSFSIGSLTTDLDSWPQDLVAVMADFCAACSILPTAVLLSAVIDEP